MENAERIDLDTEPRRAWWAVPWRRKPSRKAFLIALATLAIAAGLFFGWSWAVAAGLSSVLLGLLPCVAMCAAGLCAHRLGQKKACAGSLETSLPPQSNAAKPIAGTEIDAVANPLPETAASAALPKERG
jgi:hypothetical protein